MQKHYRFIYSEKIHLKALELLLFGFPEKVKLLDHFLQSYNKNYSFNILGIQEVDEPSKSFSRTSEYYDHRFDDQFLMTQAGQQKFIKDLKDRLGSQSEA